MKKHSKFSAIIITILLAFILGTISLMNLFNTTDTGGNSILNPGDKKNNEINSLEKAIKVSDRINILLLGKEKGPRTDTIIFASYDPKSKDVELISIPRDTYYHEPGYDRADQRKINAAFGRKGEKGTVKAVSDILNLPIDYYARIDYNGVKTIVNKLGGIEIDIPFDMNTPGGLLKKGTRVLNGKQAVGFIRFRKGYKNGDLGRVDAQQVFIKAVIDRALDELNILDIMNVALKNVKTDVGIVDAVKLASKIKGFNSNNINMITLPGYAEYKNIGGQNLSFFFHNEEETKNIVKKLYNFNEVAIEDENTKQNNN